MQATKHGSHTTLIASSARQLLRDELHSHHLRIGSHEVLDHPRNGDHAPHLEVQTLAL